VDVSGEMVALAKQALADRKNAFVYRNNGKDLSVLPPGPPSPCRHATCPQILLHSPNSFPSASYVHL
jgi:hypothetical protein